MSTFQFDARNAADFADATERIRDALHRIAQDKNQSATKANLAKLSGVHRNTLYKRALSGSGDGGLENGWPFSELSAIVQERKVAVDGEIPVATEPPAEKELDDLRQRLEKSRYVAAGWFRRSIQLKQERDEARRQVELLLEQAAGLKCEIDDLRQRLKNQIGVLK